MTVDKSNKCACWLQLTALFILPIICFAAGGCTKKKTASSDTLVIGTEKSVATLDPRLATDTYSVRAARLVFSGLFRIDNNLKITPHLAKRFILSEDGKTYDIWLRDDVTFHDGTPLTLRDVVATYRFILSPESKSAYRNGLASIEKMDIVGGNQLRLTLKERNSTFLSALIIGIVPERFEEEAFQPIGSGPYRVLEFNGKGGLKLVRFDNYFEGPAKITHLLLKPVLDDGVRLLELMKGSVDLIQNAVSPTLLGRAKANKDIVVSTSDGLAYAYIGMNLKDPVLSNLKVRKAIAHAIDRQQIIQYKLKGLGAPANSLLSPSHYLYNETLPQISFDVARAKQLLDEAGYKDPDGDGPKPRFKLSFKTSTNPERVEIVQVLIDYLAAVGIQAEMRSLEFGSFFDDIKKGNFQLYTLEWSGIFSEDIFYYVFHSASIPPDGANRGHFMNKDIDALAERGRQLPEGEERTKVYRDIQQILFDEMPYVSLWYRMNLVAHRTRLSGYQVNTVADYAQLMDSSLRE